jgi:DNA topoisomerase-1
MNVVVVESPAKAKTINKYLGPDYTVIASYGHVRDLPAKDGSVRPDAGFAMDWEVDGKAQKHLRAIADALRGATRLYLATDPDREGEAISWHVCEVLRERKALSGIDIKRVVFNEITRSAIVDAFTQPRDLDQELIKAYLARRALDYLVGFTLSPVLWRKLPGSRSAGRVQSVALRLICERETEIEDFRSREYWTVRGTFATPRGEIFTAGLTHLDGRKLEKFDLPDEATARRAVEAVEARPFAVDQVERKQTRRHPPPPFITSTLQQEAFRKLGLSAVNTMRIAQRLYEGVPIGGETVGLITYMRTDGVNMAMDAVSACRRLIETEFGSPYLPGKPRLYKSKAKNAQEAHEAIRPTDVSRHPQDVAPFLDADQLRLYKLIWKRTIACQMEAAVLDQVAVDLASPDRQVMLRATGSVITFDGFLKLYREGRDDPDSDAGAHKQDLQDDDESRLLPPMQKGEPVDRRAVEAEQHFTQPPPRFTEASLVKRLEELGIGRPSTYASILSVLQERKYVRLDSKRFIPEDRGRLVTAFLTSFFERYVAYGFTAAMEEKLDDVSGGRIDWKVVLGDFWREFSASVDDTKGLRVKEVLDALDRLLGPHFFRETGDGADPRICPACSGGRLSLKLGKFGAFIGCSNYPDCRYTRPLVAGGGEEPAAVAAVGAGNGREIGTDPESGKPVSLRKGPYGFYVQLGNGQGADAKGDKNGSKPKRTSIPPGVDIETLDLDRALAILALPRTLGIHPETGETISAGIGRFGPYLKTGDAYVSLKKDEDILSIGLNRAVDLIASRPKPKTPPGRNLGDHPKDGKPVTVRPGRFGAYVQHGAVRATVPTGTAAEELSLEGALALLAKKSGTKAGSPAPAATEDETPKPERNPKAGAKSKPSPKPEGAPLTKAKAKSKVTKRAEAGE